MLDELNMHPGEVAMAKFEDITKVMLVAMLMRATYVIVRMLVIMMVGMATLSGGFPQNRAPN